MNFVGLYFFSFLMPASFFLPAIISPFDPRSFLHKNTRIRFTNTRYLSIRLYHRMKLYVIIGLPLSSSTAYCFSLVLSHSPFTTQGSYLQCVFRHIVFFSGSHLYNIFCSISYLFINQPAVLVFKHFGYCISFILFRTYSLLFIAVYYPLVPMPSVALTRSVPAVTRFAKCAKI